MDLAEEIYRLTKFFPKDELYGLTSQIRRAAVSIPSNIAEGHSRQSTAEFRNFISIAQGSLAELETQLLLALRFRYLAPDQVTFTNQVCSEISKMLHALRTKLKAPSP